MRGNDRFFVDKLLALCYKTIVCKEMFQSKFAEKSCAEFVLSVVFNVLQRFCLGEAIKFHIVRQNRFSQFFRCSQIEVSNNQRTKQIGSSGFLAVFQKGFIGVSVVGKSLAVVVVKIVERRFVNGVHIELVEETGTVESRRDLSISYGRLGDIHKAKGSLEGALEYYEKGLELNI